jgi:hypothetical protein
MSLATAPRFRKLAPVAVTTAWLLAAAVLPSATRGDEPAKEPGVLPSDPIFTARLIDGGQVKGRISRFGADGAVTVVPEGKAARVIPARSLVSLVREGEGALLTLDSPAVLFPGGDRLYRATLGAASETTLKVSSYSVGDLSVPLESMLGLILSPPSEPDAADALVLRVREEPRTTEVLWLANGDRLTGGFLGLTEKAVSFQAGKQPVELDRAGVVALGFDPSLVAYPRPEGPYFEVTFADASRLGLTGLTLEHGHVHGTTRFGAALKVPLGELRRVDARTPSVVYLSERPAAAEKYVPYIGPPRPYRRDATVDGHPIRLAGREYDRGLGAQSRTLLAYRLENADRRFQALVGVDDRAGALGSVVFRVLVDNTEKFASPPLTSRDAPRFVDVDLAGGKTLILITEFGDRGGVLDLADWAEARLIR